MWLNGLLFKLVQLSHSDDVVSGRGGGWLNGLLFKLVQLSHSDDMVSGGGGGGCGLMVYYSS